MIVDNFIDFLGRYKVALISVIAFFVCCGIGLLIYDNIDRTPPLRSGVITSKSYDDPDSWYVPPVWVPPTQTCSGGFGSQPRVCTTNPGVFVPGYTAHDGPHWYIKIKGSDEYGDREREVGVTQAAFNGLAVGDYWSEAE